MKKAVFSLLLVFVLLLPVKAAGSIFTDVVVFGDSISDVGNAFILSSLLDPPPVPGFPYFNGRFTNGPNYADVLATNLGLGPLVPSVMGGTNFAIGGARAGFHPDLPDFGIFEQVDTFLDAVEVTTGVRELDPDTLFVVWGGSNDIRDALFAPDPAMSLNAAAQSLFDAVDALAEANAKHIIVPTAPDIGLVPEVLAAPLPGLSETATLFSSTLNDTLDALLAELIYVNIIRFDSFTLLQDAAASLFGFTDVDSPCYTGPLEGVSPEEVPSVTCSNPDAFLFWDDLHPSARAHLILGRQMRSAVPETTTLALLGIGLAGLGLGRRMSRLASKPRANLRRRPGRACGRLHPRRYGQPEERRT